MHDPLDPIRSAIRNGDQTTARSLLRPVLKEEPSAEAWYLASQVAATPEQRLDFLRRALQIDPWHNAANRAIYRLEGGKPKTAELREQTERQEAQQAATSVQLPVERQLRKTEVEKRDLRRRRWSRLGCFFGLLLSMSCSAFALSAVGIAQGLLTNATILTGGPTPVRVYDNVPIEQLDDDPAAYIPAAQSEPAQAQSMNMLEHGYVHEYLFQGAQNATVAVYVQFMSLSANRVSRNVALLDPAGRNMISACEQNTIVQGGDNNLALICRLAQNGGYRVRVLGRSGESVGAYFVGVTSMSGEMLLMEQAGS